MTAFHGPARRRPAGVLPPWAIFPLLLPWSVSGTFLLVTMAYFLSNVGVSIAAVAVYSSAVMIPDTFKVFWAPLADATLGPKRWHAIGVAGTIVGLAVIAVVPVTRDNLSLITALAIACATATTLVPLANDIFVTYDVDPDRKARAAGWWSASNLGGGTLGGGLAIYLAHLGLPSWCPAVAVALICAAASPFVLMPTPRPPAGTVANPITGIRALLGDVLEMIRFRKGATALFLIVLPIGSVGMMNLVPALTRHWHAGAMAVVFVSGVGGGLVQIVGAVLGGVCADRMDRKLAYCLAGGVIAAVVAGRRDVRQHFGACYQVVDLKRYVAPPPGTSYPMMSRTRRSRSVRIKSAFDVAASATGLLLGLTTSCAQLAPKRSKRVSGSPRLRARLHIALELRAPRQVVSHRRLTTLNLWRVGVGVPMPVTRYWQSDSLAGTIAIAGLRPARGIVHRRLLGRDDLSGGDAVRLTAREWVGLDGLLGHRHLLSWANARRRAAAARPPRWAAIAPLLRRADVRNSSPLSRRRRNARSG